MDPMLASIQIFAGTFAPRGWAYCEGQLLSINAYQALFSLLGTTYGGDGRTSFALPDLRSRAAIGTKTGPGLSTYRLGETGGQETVTLNLHQIPSHTHTAIVSNASAVISGKASATLKTNTDAGTDSASGTYLADNTGGDGFAAAVGTTTLAADSIDVDTSGLGVSLNGLTVMNTNTGGNNNHTNIQPYLAINYIIALQGIFPSRN